MMGGVEFFTGGLKCEVIQSESLGIYDLFFEGSGGARIVSENSVAES